MLKNRPLILPPSAPVRPQPKLTLLQELVVTVLLMILGAAAGLFGLFALAMDPYGPHMQ